MIQLNLLPDVKLEYIRAERQRRLFISVSAIAIVVSVGLVALMLSISFAQKKHLSDLSNDIVSETNQLKSVPQINKILTVQNQLQSLTALHEKKPAASNVFGFLNQVTPANVSISTFELSFTDGTITVTGTSDALSSVNKYVDTMKFTKYKIGSSDSKPAFSSVVLKAFAVNSDTKDQKAATTYTIEMSYDPAIFDITSEPKLEVPSQVTTRSEVDKPTDLFQAAPSADSGKRVE
jgi:hypothetical protein